MYDVKAPNRVEQVISNKRAYAKEIGLDPDIVERIYHTIISCLIDQELKEHESGNTMTPDIESNPVYCADYSDLMP